ncbi:hypothetical protein [Anabaena sp. CCY 9402-a]|uniref:hypothetical protein n=1 Tax=Anabaena sp. CCY 9402-a TaxID=3103867 RepID=UPI0039C722AC
MNRFNPKYDSYLFVQYLSVKVFGVTFTHEVAKVLPLCLMIGSAYPKSIACLCLTLPSQKTIATIHSLNLP